MTNLPQSFSVGVSNFGGGGGMSSSSSSAGAAPNKDCKMQSVEQLVLVLCDPNLRENALLELFKKKELLPDLGRLLWHSFGTIAALLQEIVSIYPGLSSPSLAPAQSSRVCNAIALLQSVVSHPDTGKSFLNEYVVDRFNEGIASICVCWWMNAGVCLEWESRKSCLFVKDCVDCETSMVT